jgi:hypothetical protein
MPLPEAEFVYASSAHADVEAIARFGPTSRSSCADKLGAMDVAVLSILGYVIGSLFAFDTKDYAKSFKSLVEHCSRIEKYISPQPVI